MMLISYKIANIFLKFVRWKNIKYKTLRERIKYYTRNLNDALNKRRKELNKLQTDNDNLNFDLDESAIDIIFGKAVIRTF